MVEKENDREKTVRDAAFPRGNVGTRETALNILMHVVFVQCAYIFANQILPPGIDRL